MGLGQRFVGDCNFYCCGLVIFRRGRWERETEAGRQTLPSCLGTVFFIRLGFLMDSRMHSFLSTISVVAMDYSLVRSLTLNNISLCSFCAR